MHAGLSARRPEIERVVLERTQALSSPAAVDDPQYVEGLRRAVSATVGYALEAISRADDHPPSMPLALISQARLAARCGVTLDTALRRCCAGHGLLGDFLVEEAERGGASGAELKGLLRGHAALLDRLLAAVSEEYLREQHQEGVRTSEDRRTDLLRRLLGGELVDPSSLEYDLEGIHVGIVGSGQVDAGSLQRLAASLDRRLLVVRPDELTLWAWLGGRDRADPEEMDAIVAAIAPAEAIVAFGEEAEGPAGWRLTHRQAAAAMSVAHASPHSVVRYADMALLASVAQDDVLVTSLRLLYLDPIESDGGEGEIAKETLSAYFEADRNISSAAAALGANRNTVASRLRAIEKRLGRRLDVCAADLEAALGVDRLRRSGATRPFVDSLG